MPANSLPVTDEDSFCGKLGKVRSGNRARQVVPATAGLLGTKLDFYFFPAFFTEVNQVLPPSNPDQGERQHQD
jgi:hypothetical protein